MLTNTIITGANEENKEKIFSILKGLGNKPRSIYGDTERYPIIKIYSDGEFGIYPDECSDQNYTKLTAEEFFDKYTPPKQTDWVAETLTDLVKEKMKEFFSDEPKCVPDEKYLNPDWGIKPEDIPDTRHWYGKSVVEELEKYKHTFSVPCDGKEKTKNMSIVNFFNDLTVSADDKELRKAGLKDGYLNWTSEARYIIYNLEAKERGYKNSDDMEKKLGEDAGYSVLELDNLFTKFSSKLLETAKKYNRKDEKKAK